MMESIVKSLEQILVSEEIMPSTDWQLRSVQSGTCLSYVVWNLSSREALVIDPKDEDLKTYLSIREQLKDYLWLGVIDSHTHADHVSAAARLSSELGAPLYMQLSAPSARVELRVAKDTALVSRASPVRLIHTPGHTPDSMTIVWGPFVFAGDTVLDGDTGRDDLPGGDARAHYRSLQLLKGVLAADQILLPGHDSLGGRASTWGSQLRSNPSLLQSLDNFVQESEAFDAPAPALLKRALFENFK